MTLYHRPKLKINYLALAFFIPWAGMMMVMLISGYEPFGKYSMLYSDMYHQYYPFFVAFRRALRSGDSLLYSWNVGMGMDYLGLISYYLASPLNLLSVLVPEGWLLEFFSLLMPVKLGLAGLFFAIFLKEIFRRNDFSISAFGGFYGLCAWALGFQWNIMWLDTFALLPLVVLGAVRLLRDRKFILYTATLFLAVFSNYYIGFFVCIFIFLLFFIYEICRWQGWKRFFADLLRIAFFSLLAIGMTAILELPAFAALQTTQSSVNKFPTEFRLNIAGSHTILGLLDAMRQVAGNMGGALEPNFKEGLPNLYCGVGSILLGSLYLFSDEVKLRDKLCAVFLLLFFNVSFIIRQLDYIWHGFHFTNMIPYRFSFLHSFVLLYMAYRAWTLRKSYTVWHVLVATSLTAFFLSCSNDLLTMTDVELLGMELPVYIIYNVSFLVLYAAFLIYGAVQQRIPEDTPEEERETAEINRGFRLGNARLLLLAVMVVELMAGLTSFGLYFPGTGVSNYPKGTEYAASMIRYMHEREEDTLFYRAETTHSQTLNDGALNGYNGVSTFTSSANVKVTEFMRALGYGAKNTYNRYCYEEASPVSNLFLGIKYMIERDGKDKQSAYFDYIHQYGNTGLYRNSAYLPLGFLANRELADVDFFGDVKAFRLQNRIFSGATGIEEDVWRTVAGENLTIEGVDVTISDQNSNGYCSYSDGVAGSAVVYTYTANQDGFMCLNLNLPKRNKVSISLNGTELYSETTSLEQMMAVGDVTVGDVVTVRLTCNENEKGTMTLTGAILNDERFREGYEILAASQLELISFENTHIEGTIDCDRDGLLYASIPQNGNWSVLVDGKEAEIKLVGDCMVAVELTEGAHTITYKYRNDAFELGWKITLACAVIFALLILKFYKPRGHLVSRKGKYVK